MPRKNQESFIRFGVWLPRRYKIASSRYVGGQDSATESDFSLISYASGITNFDFLNIQVCLLAVMQQSLTIFSGPLITKFRFFDAKCFRI